MTDILDLPDWTLIAKRSDGDEYELEAEYRLLPGGCVKCGTIMVCRTCNARFHTKPHGPSSAASTR